VDEEVNRDKNGEADGLCQLFGIGALSEYYS